MQGLRNGKENGNCYTILPQYKDSGKENGNLVSISRSFRTLPVGCICKEASYACVACRVAVGSRSGRFRV